MMKFVTLFFLDIFLSANAFAVTHIIFSNNSISEYSVTSKSLDENSNLVLNRDYTTVNERFINSWLSNIDVLNFNSNDNIKNGREYHFKVDVFKREQSNQSLTFYITTKGLLYGSQIIETRIVTPSGQNIVLNPEVPSAFRLFEWDNAIVRFVPYTTTEKGVSWPSYVLTLDSPEKDGFNFSAHNRFKALSYNIQLFPFYGDFVNPPNNKTTRTLDIPKLIGNNYDFVALYEVFDYFLRAQIILDMKNNYPYYVDATGNYEPPMTPESATNILTGGVVVFSKWPILETKYFTYKSCYSEDCYADKGVTYVKIKKTVNGMEQNYNIFSTHLQAGNPKKEGFPRTKQIRELNNFIKAQNISKNEPVLLTGDLNVDRFETEIENYNGSFPQNEYDFMLSTLNASDPEQTGLKYSSDFILNTMLGLSSTSQAKIDYVLYLNDYRLPLRSINSVRVMRDTLNPTMYPIYDLSDHFPVVGEFVF